MNGDLKCPKATCVMRQLKWASTCDSKAANFEDEKFVLLAVKSPRLIKLDHSCWSDVVGVRNKRNGGSADEMCFIDC